VTYDLKREHRHLYAPKQQFTVVDVPALNYLMVDGHGDPNTAPAYREAVEALYRASYLVRKLAGQKHVVAPLEGLWWADDLGAFTARDKGAWQWTMMIAQPDFIIADMVPYTVRLERFDEGRCVQILHVGSYDDETPVLAQLHEQYLPANALTERGKHHEIYLSDPRTTEPAKLRTIPRQPVEALD
jgi:hypothetical protein